MRVRGVAFGNKGLRKKKWEQRHAGILRGKIPHIFVLLFCVAIVNDLNKHMLVIAAIALSAKAFGMGSETS